MRYRRPHDLPKPGAMSRNSTNGAAEPENAAVRRATNGQPGSGVRAVVSQPVAVVGGSGGDRRNPMKLSWSLVGCAATRRSIPTVKPRADPALRVMIFGYLSRFWRNETDQIQSHDSRRGTRLAFTLVEGC